MTASTMSTAGILEAGEAQDEASGEEHQGDGVAARHPLAVQRQAASPGKHQRDSVVRTSSAASTPASTVKDRGPPCHRFGVALHTAEGR